MEADAEEIVVEEMKRRRCGEEQLGRRAKGDARKVAMAARVRAETAVKRPCPPLIKMDAEVRKKINAAFGKAD